MRASRAVPVISVLLSLFLLPRASLAAIVTFSDVPPTHPFSAPILALADAGIVNGNPDGTFAPDAALNRAAFLTMLYRAEKWTPPAPAVPCKTDVPTGAWFSAVVCNAIERGFVSGYDDGTFKPERAVSRAEALKMAQAVLGLPVPPLTIDGLAQIRYADVPATAWYAKYVLAAQKNGILPIIGQDAALLMPDKEMTRGEAAAYVFNAARPAAAQESSSSSAESSAAAQSSSQAPAQAPASASASAQAQSTNKTVDAVFSDNGTFVKKTPALYRFTLKKETVLQIDVGTPDGKPTCRLYKLEKDGTSFEYYLGWTRTGSCSMRVSLTPGDYQLDLRPTTAGGIYQVSAKVAKGDGNDGFSQAKTATNKPSASVLETNDTADWYRFTLASPKNMTVEVTNAANLSCMVYPMKDVDLDGFILPECNAPYAYPAGTYVIGVSRGASADLQDFTIQLK